MKKATLISTIILATIFAGIYVSYHSVESFRHQIRKEVKRKIKAGLTESEMTLLIIPNEQLGDLKWKHSKEFKLKGQMYDVIKKENIEWGVKYWCWWDNDETELNKRLNRMLILVLGSNPLQNEQENFVDIGKTTMFWENIQVELAFNSITNGNIAYTNNYQLNMIQKLFKPPVLV